MSAAPWRVLVADDDPTACLLTRAALGAGDFALTLVGNGHDAVAEFQRAEFDIALIDVEMPGLDGFAVGAAIRQARGAAFPLVLVTGRSDPAALEAIGRLGACLLVKPVDWAALPAFLLGRLAAASF